MKSCNGIIGFAVGDALGVPVEFKSRQELEQNGVTDMIGYGTYNVPKGTWSDDTSMTLATMDSIIQKQKIDTDDIADKFLKWYRNSEYTAIGTRFDIGTTTIQALAKYELKLEDAINCGGKGEYENGNGSLMRMLPIAYYIYYNNIADEEEIYNIVKQVSSITHAHEISILGCYIYVKFTLELLKGIDKIQAYQNIQQLDYSYFNDFVVSKYYRILENNIQEIKKQDISSSGYVVSTLEATLWLFLNSKDYNGTILKAVNLGEDTDTVGACVGGLLGIYYGIECIKENWKQSLRKYDYIIDLCNKFDEVKRNINMGKLKIVSGDIIQNSKDVEAIVNPANKYMNCGCGVSGAIYKAAGIEDMENYCHNRWLKDMEINEIRITTGFALLKDIIHIYAPIYIEEEQPIEKLREGYLKLLDIIKREGYKSVIIPSIGTGFHGYLHEEVAEMVIKVLVDFCENNEIEIVFNLYDDETKQIYEQYIKQ